MSAPPGQTRGRRPCTWARFTGSWGPSPRPFSRVRELESYERAAKPELTPKRNPALSIDTAVYFFWAYTPERVLHALGIHYYPSK